MPLISQPIISNGMYLLLSLVGFLVYAFLYLSYQGLLSGKKNDLHKRPPVSGFDSMRGGSPHMAPHPQHSGGGLDSEQEPAEEDSFFFDHQATFPGSPPQQTTLPQEELWQEPLHAAGYSPYAQEEANGEEEEDSDWPSPGEDTGGADDEDLDGPMEGDLTDEERQLLSRVRYSLATDPEAYPYLDEEYRVIEDRIARLIGHKGKSREEVISESLESREKIILNAVNPGGRNTVGTIR